MKSVYSVSQINAYIKNMFRQDYLLSQVLVRGEVSNCKYHSSGHIYFTMKDEGGTLSCVMFAGNVRKGGLRFRMSEGDEVIVLGTVDVYEKTGSYQLYAQQIVRDGAGALNARFDQLKKKLEEEGMFDERYKQPIPKYIRTLGVVTAPTGAAVRDIINIATRRNPYIRIILYPALVQGEGAKESIVNGIRALDSLPPEIHPDTIIVGRGGGSLEDLWAFNEEIVAQAVFECRTPVISAVGHETDTVITDYVADLRAPTPSAGAELAVFDVRQFFRDLSASENSLTDAMSWKIRQARQTLDTEKRSLIQLSPAAKIREQRMMAATASDRLTELMRSSLQRAGTGLLLYSPEKLTGAMTAVIGQYKNRLSQYSEENLTGAEKQKIKDAKHTLAVLSAGLDGVSPLKKLGGGFGYISMDGRNINSAAELKPGDLFDVRLSDGSVTAEAKSVELDSSDLDSEDAGTGRRIQGWQ